MSNYVEFVSKTLVPSLVRLVRGDRSQQAINRKMNYSYNQISKWERGSKEITWPEFSRLCKAVGIDLDVAIGHFFSKTLSANEHDRLLQWLIRPFSATQVAGDLGVSVRQVNRWLNGEGTPRLVHVLQIIEAYHNWILIPLLAHIVPLEELKSIKVLAQNIKVLESINRDPEVGLVYEASKLIRRSQRSIDASAISKLVGIAAKDAQCALEKLRQAGVLTSSGKVHDLPVSTWANIEDDIRAKIYWIEKTLRVLQASLSAGKYVAKGRFGHFVFPISDAGFFALSAELTDFFTRSRAIVDRDRNPKTRVATLGVQLWPGDSPQENRHEF